MRAAQLLNNYGSLIPESTINAIKRHKIVLSGGADNWGFLSLGSSIFFHHRGVAMNHEQKITKSDQQDQSHSIQHWWRLFLSVLAAAVGVQSDKNRHRDFTHFSPWSYIFAGLLFMALFVGLLIGIVYLVL